MDVAAKRRQRWLDLEHLGAVQHPPVNAVAAHQCCAGRPRLEVGLRREEVQDAAFQPLVLDAGDGHHAFQRVVAVASQGHQLAHISLKRSVVALAQKGPTPAPLVRVEPGPKQQRRVIAQRPFRQLEGRASVGPGLAEADRDLRAVGRAGL